MIELFTFLRSGHDRTKIKVYQLTASEDDDVTASFTTFDASKAQCHKKSDRERLLAVIESGFGDFRPFNRLVRGIFAKPRKSQLAVFNPVNQVAQSVRCSVMRMWSSGVAPRGAGGPVRRTARSARRYLAPCRRLSSRPTPEAAGGGRLGLALLRRGDGERLAAPAYATARCHGAATAESAGASASSRKTALRLVRVVDDLLVRRRWQRRLLAAQIEQWCWRRRRRDHRCGGVGHGDDAALLSGLRARIADGWPTCGRNCAPRTRRSPKR